MGVLTKKTSAWTVAGMLGIGLAGGLTGCTSYTNVPSPDNALAGQDPNARQASAATLAGLRWAVRKHPVSGPYLLNLPVGTSTETAERIASSLGPGATIPDGSGISLPTYHVPRVWIRLSDAKVDVVFPVMGVDGVPFNRGVTTWLHAGVRPWTVSRGQYWIPGTVDVPPTWVPGPQAQLDAMERADREARRAFRRGEADAAGLESDARGLSAEEPMPANEGMSDEAVEMRVYEPAATPSSEPTTWEPISEPVGEPAQQPAQSPSQEPAEQSTSQPTEQPAPGAVWREVPTRGGE
jgi:hypothetical protein